MAIITQDGKPPMDYPRPGRAKDPGPIAACPGCGGVLKIQPPITATRDGVTRTVVPGVCQGSCVREVQKGWKRLEDGRTVPRMAQKPAYFELPHPIPDELLRPAAPALPKIQDATPMQVRRAMEKAGWDAANLCQKIKIHESSFSRWLRSGTGLGSKSLVALTKWHQQAMATDEKANADKCLRGLGADEALERLDAAINAAGLTRSKLCRRMGWHRGTLNTSFSTGVITPARLAAIYQFLSPKPEPEPPPSPQPEETPMAPKRKDRQETERERVQSALDKADLSVFSVSTWLGLGTGLNQWLKTGSGLKPERLGPVMAWCEKVEADQWDAQAEGLILSPIAIAKRKAWHKRNGTTPAEPTVESSNQNSVESPDPAPGVESKFLRPKPGATFDAFLGQADDNDPPFDPQPYPEDSLERIVDHLADSVLEETLEELADDLEPGQSVAEAASSYRNKLLAAFDDGVGRIEATPAPQNGFEMAFRPVLEQRAQVVLEYLLGSKEAAANWRVRCTLEAV